MHFNPKENHSKSNDTTCNTWCFGLQEPRCEVWPMGRHHSLPNHHPILPKTFEHLQINIQYYKTQQYAHGKRGQPSRWSVWHVRQGNKEHSIFVAVRRSRIWNRHGGHGTVFREMYLGFPNSVSKKNTAWDCNKKLNSVGCVMVVSMTVPGIQFPDRSMFPSVGNKRI